MSNLGLLYSKLGQFQASESTLLKVLEIRENIFGKNHSDVASSLNNLGMLYDMRDRPVDAREMFERSLEILEEHFGRNSAELATPLNNLAMLCKDEGKLNEALKLLDWSLRIRESEFGPNHIDTANALGNLATVYFLMSDVQAAERATKRAFDILEKNFHHTHPLIVLRMSDLAHLSHFKGDLPGANSLTMDCLKRRRLYLSRMFKFFPEDTCLAMQEVYADQNLVGVTRSGPNAARHQIWFKGGVQEALHQRRSFEFNLINLEGGEALLQELQTSRKIYQNALLTNGPDSIAAETSERALDLLAAKVRDRQNEGGFVPNDETIFDRVKGSLSENEILIEIFKYYDDFAAQKGDRYSCAIIESDRESKYLSFGQAEPIDEAINNYRSALIDFQGSESERSTSLEESESVLWNLVLAPLEEHIDSGKSAIFSLDSQFHFMPLGMVRNPDGVPFGQMHPVRYVTSGRDLVRKPSASTGRKSAFILGNPSYRNNSPLKALAEKSDSFAPSESRNGVSNDAGSVSFRPIPGTAIEIQQISKKLVQNGYQVLERSRNDATEEALQQCIAGNRIIHLATHGFFLNEITIPNRSQLSPLGSGDFKDVSHRSVQDPMLRSGLALTGAQVTFNLWKNGQIPPPSRDGILTAAEANLLDLRGTDLVVLSACETATGRAVDGEGVMGLRRAFFNSGANNTILTFWPVDDRATVEVMNAFYDKYLDGTHPVIALAEVQNELYGPFFEKYGEVEAIAKLAPFVCMSVGKIQ